MEKKFLIVYDFRELHKKSFGKIVKNENIKGYQN